MEEKLRDYMEQLFAEVKPTKKAVELKEEILQNLVDKYHDLTAAGKTPEAAYNIAVASVGDMDELLSGLKEEQNKKGEINMEEFEQGRKKSAILTSVAVMLYILCVVPAILLSGSVLEDTLAPILMFSMVAVATGLLIYNNMTRPRHHKMDDSIVEEFKEWQGKNDADRRALKAISSALWALIVVVYISFSFLTGAWHISWIIFLIGAAIEGVIKAIFELKRR